MPIACLQQSYCVVRQALKPSLLVNGAAGLRVATYFHDAIQRTF